MTSSRSPGIQFVPPISNLAGHVYVTQVEYDHLIQTARKYGNLCQSLQTGGIDNDTINILSNFAADPQPPSLLDFDSDLDRPAAQPARLSRSTPYGQGLDPAQPSFSTACPRPDAFPQDVEHARYKLPGSVADAEEGPSAPNDVHQRKEQLRPSLDREATRTLQFSNLPEGVRHADITAIVRGGQLLDVYLRRKDGTATVSFVHGKDAKAYYNYVRRNDLYINNKKVELSWNERQYTLPGHVAHKIMSGATRNIVIRRCDPNLTEESVREDLDHIHNLIVVRVDFIADNCFIATNSVSCASFARSCMMSRLKYRGTRIEWDIDECAQSLDRMPAQRRRATTAVATAPPPRKCMPLTNRFQLLDPDEDDDSGSDDGDSEDDMSM